MVKRPAFQFYPGDWQHDSHLRSCSLFARGLWIEMMCVMHQGYPYGYFLVNQKSPSSLTCARLFGCTVEEYEKCLQELEDAGVFSRDKEGKIYSRRMIKDEYLRNIRRDAGSKGGNPSLLAKKSNNLVNQISNQNNEGKDNQIPTPSSSSSSPSSKVLEREELSREYEQEKITEKISPEEKSYSLSEDFDFNDVDKATASNNGFDLNYVFEKFRSYQISKGKKSFMRSEWRIWLVREIEHQERQRR